LQHAPSDYERKQTLVNAERFTTPELKELESKILDAEDKMLALEREIFQQLRLFAAEHASRIRQTGLPLRSWMLRARWHRWLLRIATLAPVFQIRVRFASSLGGIR